MFHNNSGIEEIYRQDGWGKEGASIKIFHQKFFCLTVPKDLAGEHFCVSQNFWHRKYELIREGGRGRRSITIFCQVFLSHSTENFRRGTFLCFTKLLVSKNFMDKRWGGGKERGVSRCSVKCCLSHSTTNFRSGTIQCFMIFGYRKNL